VWRWESVFNPPVELLDRLEQLEPKCERENYICNRWVLEASEDQNTQAQSQDKTVTKKQRVDYFAFGEACFTRIFVEVSDKTFFQELQDSIRIRG
jgi:hypothetical protein